jgi:hypothetical protein
VSTPEIERRLVLLENSLSERLARVEDEVLRLARRVTEEPRREATAWWKTIVGVFKDDPEFDEAMRLGRAYRESLRPIE